MSTAELLEVRALARQFAEAELRPHTEAWDTERSFGGDVVPKLAELGFFGMLVPEAAGGMGFDAATYLSALEQIAWGEAGVAMLVAQSVSAGDMIARLGGPDEVLGRLAGGEATACIVWEGGDEPLRAERAGDAWHITGTSPWVSNGADAAVAVVRAETADGAMLFVVERDAWAAGEPAHTLGLRALPLVPLTFDGAAAVELGAVTDDIDRAGLLSVAAVSLGISAAALEHAVRYAGEREQFGRAIRHFEGIQVKLAEMDTRTSAARALLMEAAAGEDIVMAAKAKLAAAECAMFVTTEAVQVYGGYGYMRDYPVEKLMRDAKAMSLVHGTSESQRSRIAAALYAD